MTSTPNSSPDANIWYRFESRYYSGGVDEDGYSYGPPRLVIGLSCFKELGKTKCGRWIERYEYYHSSNPPKRFILDKSRKKYAYPTVEQAWESFRLRKQRQCSILKSQLEKATMSLSASELPLAEASKRYNFTLPSPNLSNIENANN